MTRLSSLIAILALALAAGTVVAGCVPPCGTELQISRIAVADEDDGILGRLDIEVHLFDASTRVHLGCAGKSEGLEDVDLSDREYEVEAHFYRPQFDDPLFVDDVFGRSIELQVIEDDADPCPEAPGTTDDVVGISPALDGSNLAEVTGVGHATDLAFDNVVLLRIQSPNSAR